MTIDGLIEQFHWTPESEVRNDLTSRYEPVQPFILKALLRRLSDVTFLDVGANVGFYGVVMGAEEAVGEVHAFEPMPAAAAATRSNLTMNLAGKKFFVHQLAASDQRGQLEFAVRGPLAGANGALGDSPFDRKDVSVESVRCDRVDDVVAMTGRQVVIKIDVEGHELSTLGGAVETLKNNTGFLQLEMHPSESNADKFALLESLGWHLITRAGADHYFSNIRDYYEDRGVIAGIFEEAMEITIEASRSPARASRRRVGPGVYVQISRSQVNAVKGLLRALPGRGRKA